MNVFVVENGDIIATMIEVMLEADERLELVGVAATGPDALAQIAEASPDLVILDQFLDGATTGLQLAPEIKAISPNAKIILYSDFDLSYEASQEPAIDTFLEKKRVAHLLPTVLRTLGLSAQD